MYKIVDITGSLLVASTLRRATETAAAIAARHHTGEFRVELETPVERDERLGGGCRVRWQSDDGRWHDGGATVTSGGDAGHEITIEQHGYVGRDLVTLHPDRVRRV